MNKYSVTAACTYILTLGLSNSVATSLSISYNLYLLSGKICRPGSLVGIATDYGLKDPGSNTDEDEIFRPSRTAMGTTQPLVKWVPGLSWG